MNINEMNLCYKKLDKNGQPLDFNSNEWYSVQEKNSNITQHITFANCVSDTELTKEQALEYIDNLNKQNYAGFNDWKLPIEDDFCSFLKNMGEFSVEKYKVIFQQSDVEMQFWTATSIDNILNNETHVKILSIENDKYSYIMPEISGKFFVRACRKRNF